MVEASRRGRLCTAIDPTRPSTNCKPTPRREKACLFLVVIWSRHPAGGGFAWPSTLQGPQPIANQHLVGKRHVCSATSWLTHASTLRPYALCWGNPLWLPSFLIGQTRGFSPTKTFLPYQEKDAKLDPPKTVGRERNLFCYYKREGVTPRGYPMCVFIKAKWQN